MQTKTKRSKSSSEPAFRPINFHHNNSQTQTCKSSLPISLSFKDLKSIRTVLIINFKLLVMAVSTDFKLINMVMTINR